MLGSGTPNADPDHSGPAVAIVVGDAVYLVDAGPGIVRRASLAARTDSIKALEAKNLNRVFITHLHSDHTAGLPDFILTPAVLDRDAPLEIYGPPGSKRMVNLLLKAYSEDINIRLHGLEPSNPRGYEVHARDVKPGVVYKDANVTVRAFAVKHGSWPQSYGYRFETPGRTIVVSGDTVPAESIIEACNGCDVLIHEVYSTTGFAGRPPEWQRYHSSFHTSSKKLAEIATKAKPKLLILYHQLLWSASKEQLMAELRQGYSGTVVFGNDLDVY